MRTVCSLALLIAIFCSCNAFGGVILYTERSGFNAQGTIIYNSNFADFANDHFAWPGNPFSRGGVTYTSSDNLTVDCCYSIGLSQTVITNNYWSPVTGNISTSPTLYDLFGFDIAVTAGNVGITIYTNLGNYIYSEPSLPNGNPEFAFRGFMATGGEYFTGFRIDTQGYGYLAGMTNVAVGTSGEQVIPEPGSFLLLGAGLAFLLLRRRAA